MNLRKRMFIERFWCIVSKKRREEIRHKYFLDSMDMYNSLMDLGGQDLVIKLK